MRVIINTSCVWAMLVYVVVTRNEENQTRWEHGLYFQTPARTILREASARSNDGVELYFMVSHYLLPSLQNSIVFCEGRSRHAQRDAAW